MFLIFKKRQKKNVNRFKIFRLSIFLFIFTTNYTFACDPATNPFCKNVELASPTDCDPLLDPFCEEVGVPLDKNLYFLFALVSVLGYLKLSKPFFFNY